MPSKRLDRLQILLNDEELAAIEEWRFEHRMPSRSAAVRAMIHVALKSLPSSDAPERPTREIVSSRDIGIVKTDPSVAAALGVGDRKRILIVEDEFLIAAGIRSLVEEAGFDVIGPAGSIDEAIQALKRDERPDGAILDVSLNRQELAALTEELKARRIPFVFCTADDAQGMLPEHLDGVPVINNPFVRDGLRDTLVELCN